MSALVQSEARTTAIGVVLPVHNEESLLGGALEAIGAASEGVVRRGLALATAIVLDACSDDSEAIARSWARDLSRADGQREVVVVPCDSARVGSARRAGATALLRLWSRVDPSRIWLATTDADSCVPINWLEAQLEAHEAGVDLWSGRVAVDDWSPHRPATAHRWHAAYADEVAPVHGANLGFNARSYLDAGGFAPLDTGEDRALYQAIIDLGGRPHHDSDVRVVTSGRRLARAPMGFSTALRRIEADLRSELIA